MAVRSLRLMVMCSALSLATPGVAWAQESKADVLFREGREATRRGDHQLACQKFAESYRLDAAAGTLINLGTCEEKLGRVSLAWRHLTDAVKQLPGSDDRVPIARKMLATLEKRIGRLTVVLPTDEEVPRLLLDGLEVSAVERAAPLVVDPGEHVLLATTVDGREARQAVKVAPGEQAEVRLTFPPAPSKPAPRTSSPETSDAGAQNAGAVEAGSSARKIVGWGMLLGGVAVGAGGGFYGFSKYNTLRKEADELCPPPGCLKEDPRVIESDNKRIDAKNMSILGGVSIGIGVAFIGFGTYLLLSEPAQAGKQAYRTQIVPSVSHQGTGLHLQGTW
jgi:hypothetical protein